MKPNFGEDVRSRSPHGLSSGPASIGLSEKRIHDIGKITLDQDQTPTPSPEAQQLQFPPSNPLKRGPAADIGLSEQPMKDIPSRHGKSRALHCKTQSAGPVGHGAAAQPVDRSHASDSNFVRHFVGSGKRLFDPERDNPVASPVSRQKGISDPAGAYHLLHDTNSRVYNSRGAAPTNTSSPQIQGILKTGHGHGQPQMEMDRPIPQELGTIENSQMPRDPVQSSSTSREVEYEFDQDPGSEPFLLLQPETRPISHDQLVVEVKGIYAGLVMVESKCADVDEKQSRAAREKDLSRRTALNNEQWQALIHLHRTLLHEHHDFFLASQHPSASPALSRLAAKYSMPARMWRHGIHSFLEVLRHRLPESLDHMLAFVYIAYSMMALLYETVPAFEATWIECLGDLARYRMAIEDDDIRDREIWSGVARFWYGKAADKNPDTGRLYHHLAILARPFTMQQLSFYTRSLTCLIPFESARTSVMTLFNPILNGRDSAHYRLDSYETNFIKSHAILFCRLPLQNFDTILAQINAGLLDSHIGRATSKFKEQGVSATIANVAALFEYGACQANGRPKSVLRLLYDESRNRSFSEAEPNSQRFGDAALHGRDQQQPSSIPDYSLIEKLTASELRCSLELLSRASKLTFSTLEISLRRIGDRNVYPLVHVSLAFLRSLLSVEKAIKYVEHDVPWVEICSFLNALAKPEAMTDKVWAKAFPKPDQGFGRPLPEDFDMRGLSWTQGYFPEEWFTEAAVDDEERMLELPSMVAPRVERILWLGSQIASVSLSFHHELDSCTDTNQLKRWIIYDSMKKAYAITDYVSRLLVTPYRPLEDHVEIDYSIDDQPMSEALPDVTQTEGTIQSPLTRDEKAATSAANLHQLKSKSQNPVEPDSTMDVDISPPLNTADDPNTTTWLESAPVHQPDEKPQKAPRTNLPSDPRKLSMMERFDSDTGYDPTKT